MKGKNYANFTESQIKAESIFGNDSSITTGNKITPIK